AALNLHEEAVDAGPGETVWEGDLGRECGLGNVVAGVRSGGGKQAERGGGNAPGRVQVNEDAAIVLHERGVTRHSHVELYVGGVPACGVLNTKAELVGLAGADFGGGALPD